MESKDEIAIRSKDKLRDKYYHYTSVDAMVSIMQNKALRFTRSEFLNDPADGKVLTGILEKYLEALDVTAIIKPEMAKGNKGLPSDMLKRVKPIYDAAPLIDYIKYLQKHIHLYVLSLTKNEDQVSMWNHYGNGGIAFEVDMAALICRLKKCLLAPHQYITYSPVKYISEEEEAAETITLTPCSQFPLDSQNESNIFETHSQDGEIYFRNRYQTKKLKEFIDNYIIEYFHSLNFLSNGNTISASSEPTDIFKAVHENAFKCSRQLTFKNDLTLYMLVLSALIKSKTYEHENEFRIVVFENTLEPTCKVEYGTQSLVGQKYIRPYWEAKFTDMSFIKKVILSPLTRNLPIDGDLYKETMEDFLSNCQGKREEPEDGTEKGKKTAAQEPISVKWSKHKIRW